MTFKTPSRLLNLKDSMIRTLTIEANKYDAVNMGQGFPEFPPPPEVIEELKKALPVTRHNQYTEDRGLKKLREAISQKYKKFYNWEPDPETEVTVLCGVTEALTAAILAVVERDQKVIIVEPAHENYLAAVLLAGAQPLWTELKAPDFKLNFNQIEEYCKKGARYIIFNSPHNPTGRVFSDDEMLCLKSFCEKYDLIVFADEIYEHIIYDGLIHKPFAMFSGLKDRTITTSGIGKTCNLTGWRIGHVIAPETVSHLIRRVHTFLTVCAANPLQHAAVRAFELPDAYYEDLLQKYHAARDKTMHILREIGFKANPPQGAYYVMADFSDLSHKDDVGFCYDLVQKARVAVIPGSSFYNTPGLGKNLVRLAFPKPMEVLEEARKRLGEFFNS